MSESDPEVFDHLPQLLRDIAELTSVQVALELAERLGGTRLYFPIDPAPDNLLARAVGLDTARVLARHYGNLHLDIPRFASGRKLAIARADGTAPDVARRFGVTERWVRKVRNEAPADPRQLSLLPDD